MSLIHYGNSDGANQTPVTALTPLPVSQDGVTEGTAQSASVTSGTTVLTVNTTGYGYAVLQFPSVGSGNTVIIETAADGVPGTGTTFVAAPYWRVLSSTDAESNAAFGPSASAIYLVPVTGSTLRVRVTVYSSGTITAVILLKRGTAAQPNAVTIVGPTAGLSTVGTVASGSADSGNPVKVGGKVNTAVQAFTNGNRADFQQTVTGALLIEEGGRTFQNITTATTTTVKSGAGFFHALAINTYVASATITIYDSLTATGTKVGTLTLPSTITSLAPTTLFFDAALGTGLTIVTSGATDITAIYR